MSATQMRQGANMSPMIKYVIILTQFERELERAVEAPHLQEQEYADQQEDEQYVYEEQDGELPDDALYDEELEEEEEYDDELNDEELSSSPSIPDENINFDLVYALHTFVATVDGQATVHKGDNLVLLDDSNSYWWLVRVMASQEVGYIPAENIETPYERLARLNKHRNVQITTATDDDHEQLSADALSGHLVKARARGEVNAHSGKPSALSSREKNATGPRRPREKRAVLFGKSEYVEHSGNEASDEDEMYPYEGEYDEYDEYDEEENEPEYNEEAQGYEHQPEEPREEEPQHEAHADHDESGERKGILSNVADTVGAAAAAVGIPRVSSGQHTPDMEEQRDGPVRLREKRTRETNAQASEPQAARERSPVVGLFPQGALGHDLELPSSTKESVPLRANEERKQRPGSLIGMPGAVPMFNVVRVFAGENVESDATFKTVLLNKSTTSTDLVRQAMQRFTVEDDANDYVIVLRRLDGEEHTLWPHESPLQILESLSELQEEDRGPHGTPGQSRDSVGSISSLLPDASSQRVTYDFSDDRYGKFYLVRKGPYFQREEEAIRLAPPTPEMSGDVSGRSGLSAASGASDSLLSASSTLRFTLQLALFPSDLPEGVVFHPQTGFATPQDPQHAFPASAKPQVRLLRFARNTTVAEVIEAGLASFQVLEGVVDGGDDVEARAGRGRVKYGLASVTDSGEQTLHPTSKVLAAYDTLPIFKQVDLNEVRRRSLDQALNLGAQEDLSEGDPLFVLRQVRAPVRAGAFSPGLDTPRSVSGQRPPSSMDVSRRSPAMDTRPRQVSSRLDTHTPPMLTVQPNHTQGIDLVMQDGMRLRSSRTLDSPRVRYSLLSQGSEQDVSHRLRGVLENITRPGGSSPSGMRKPSDPALSERPRGQGDLLERFAEQLPTMGESNISDNIDLMLNRIMHSPVQQPAVPARDMAVAPPQALPATAFEQTRGLNIPNKMAPLQRSGSLRSVSASDATAPRNMAARSALSKGSMGDRIVSDSNAATGTGRMREMYNIHALYGIVDALVIEAKTKTSDHTSLLHPPPLREHRRQTSTSSNTSSQAQLHRSSQIVSKLLEPTPAEKLATASNGLFALPFPTTRNNYNIQGGSVGRHYASLVSQVTSLEAALDELLRTALAHD